MFAKKIAPGLGIVLALACGGESAQAPDELATANTALSGDYHRSVTRSALSGHINYLAVNALVDTSIIGDVGESYNYSRSHFDNCYWNESIAWMNENRLGAVDAAIRFHSSRAKSDRQEVFDHLGYVIHAAQDFYAHSNWAEGHDADTVADFNSAMPSDWVSGTYNNPNDGTGSYAGAKHCPSGTPSHDQMAKDKADRNGYPDSFSRVKSQAALATKYEIDKFYSAVNAQAGYYTTDIMVELGFNHPSSWSTLSDVILYPDGRIFFFYGSNYYRYDWSSDSVDKGYPLSVSREWPGIWADGFDAAFVNQTNNKVYFFKDDQYIRYDIATDRADSGYPRSISGNWPGVWSTGIDAILGYPNGKVYFFKGDQYIRYDLAADCADSGYPKQISANWPGVWSQGIDGAFVGPNNKAYFFKGSQYIRYSVDSDAAEDGPLSIQANWPGL